MYGFIGGINTRGELYCEKHNDVKLISHKATYKNYALHQLTIDKFANDKVFYDSNSTIIIVEGVIYNYNELCQTFSTDDRGEMLEKMFRNNDINDFCDKLDGYYCGAVYDKISGELYLIIDHIGYRPLWYYCNDKKIIFSSDIDWIYRSVVTEEENFNVDSDALICLLNFGYILGDRTINKGIRKLLPGHFLKFSREEGINISQYYSLPIPKNNVSEKDTVLKDIDSCLTDSVRKAYEKDKEYGYKHIMTLSGGIDSRVLLFKAWQLGYKTTCITMGEANCTDIRISSEICNDLKQEHFVYELNNGLYLSDIDSAVEANGGTIMWPGFAHGFQLKNMIDLTEYGAIHSGDCGDVILGGSYYEGKKKLITKGRLNLSRDILAYGKSFDGEFSREFQYEEINRYNNKVLFNYYNRGVNSAGNGVYATQYFTEGSSPFMSRNLLNLMFSLPYEYTKKHILYFEYLNKYMPHACDYIWEHSGCKPNAGFFKKEGIKWKRRIDYRVFHKYSSMNPYDKWYGKNEDFREYLEEVYSDKDNINNIPYDIMEVIEKKYLSNSTVDKMLACVAVRTIFKYGTI